MSPNKTLLQTCTLFSLYLIHAGETHRRKQRSSPGNSRWKRVSASYKVYNNEAVILPLYGNHPLLERNNQQINYVLTVRFAGPYLDLQ